MGDESASGRDGRLNTFNQIKDSPCSIDRLTVTPPDLQTRLLLVLREFRDARQASTFEEVISRTSHAVETLEDLGVFSEVSARVGAGLPSKPGTCNVEVDVKEKAWYAYSASTQIGVDGTVTGNLTGRLRNLTGNCEHHSFTVGHGRPTLSDAETDATYRLRFPRVYGLPVHAVTSVHQLYQNCQTESSYMERQRGFNYDLVGSGGRTKVGYEISWLQLTDATRNQASQEVLKDFGDHIKSAVHATFVHDARVQNSTGPGKVGMAMKAQAQLAGLTPDANPLQFVQSRLDWQFAKPLSETATLTVDAATGLILPIMGCSREHRETMIQERFFLGGTSSMRGFRHKGVGPRGERRPKPGQEDKPRSDALGGDLFATFRTAVNFALPKEGLGQFGMQGHIFADTGSLAMLSGPGLLATKLERFWNEWRLSVGLGIRIPFGAAGHFEANFVQPLASFGADRLQPGFQVGFTSDPFLAVPPRHL